MQKGYILWASQKTSDYGTLVFWKKRAQGYTNILEDCQIYETFEDAKKSAMANCFGDVVPVKVEDILPFTKKETRVTWQAEALLDKCKQTWRNNEYIN